MYYDEHKPDTVVNVLGSEYGIYMNVTEADDDNMKTMDGYCDKTARRIAIAKLGDDCNLADSTVYIKGVLRHEIIHAFLFESGLNGNSVWHVDGQEHPEQMVEWLAMQFPKILNVFQEVGVL